MSQLLKVIGIIIAFLFIAGEVLILCQQTAPSPRVAAASAGQTSPGLAGPQGLSLFVILKRSEESRGDAGARATRRPFDMAEVKGGNA